MDAHSHTSQSSTTSGPNAAASALSTHFDTRTAAMELTDQLDDTIGNDADLILLFGSFHHRAAFADAATWIKQSIKPKHILGVTGESILGGDQEVEGKAGMSALALRAENMTIHPWTSTPDNPLPLHDPETTRNRLHITDDYRGAIMFADPFTVPTVKLIEAITTSRTDQPLPFAGGIASAGTQPGLNMLIIDDETHSAGAVGVTITGDIAIDFLVSQGCRPIGEPMMITKVHQNAILELGSRPAVEALQELAESLNDHEKQLLSTGLLIGTVIDEYKDRFGRGDFLMRNIVGFDRKHGAIGVGDMPRVGQTIQFHVRDADTAAEDLQLLLDAQQLSEPPFAAALFTCNGRGEKLFDEPHHDIALVHNRLGNVPLAGYFAAGEIGPITGKTFLHGQTASLMLFRAKA